MKRFIATQQQNHQKRSGVAALEAAIVTPVMLILILGTIEMGTALRASTIMQSAVREAGRLANLNWSEIVEDGDTPNAKIERDLRNYVTASGLPGAELSVTITHAGGDSDGQTFDIADANNDLEMMNITMALPYEHISLFPVRYMAGQDIRASLVMRSGLGRGGSGLSQ